MGHKGFEDGRISDSIRFYDMALDYCENQEDEAMINANKSVALLSLGCKHAALKCAESALEVNPECKRYNFIKVKVLIQLGKSGRAPRFMEEKFNQFSSLKEDENFKILFERVKLLESRSVLIFLGNFTQILTFLNFLGKVSDPQNLSCFPSE